MEECHLIKCRAESPLTSRLTGFRRENAMRPSPTSIRAVAIGIAAIATSTGLVTLAGPAGATTATSTYTAALKAAGSHGVHFASMATQQGTSISVIGDTGTTSGLQTLTVRKGKTTETLSVMLVAGTGYVKGNTAGLVQILGLTAAQGATHAGKWLSFPTTNSNLAGLVNGLQAKDLPNELKINGPLTFGTANTINGQSATAIKGTVGASATTQVPIVLYVASSGTPYPLEEVTNPSKGAGKTSLHATVFFTNWGEKTHEKAPAHSTSLLSLAPPTTSG
jgi:hypothetical protein